MLALIRCNPVTEFAGVVVGYLAFGVLIISLAIQKFTFLTQGNGDHPQQHSIAHTMFQAVYCVRTNSS